jgi:hypothetical protein
MKYGANIVFCFLLFALTVWNTDRATEQQHTVRTARTILQYLSDEYSGKPVAISITENGGLIEVLASHQGTHSRQS